jgi:hypothetical protein
MIGKPMVKIVVNPGRKVWDRLNKRDAKEGEVLDVKDVEAKILKFRGIASDAPAEQPPRPAPAPPAPPARPMPPAAPPPPVVPPPPAAAEEVPVEAPPVEEATASEEEPMRTRRPYRRRDLQPEE